MSVIGHVVPFIVVAIIIGLIATSASSRRLLPRFSLPKRPARPKRSHLRMVKTSAMDRELAELLKKKR